MIAAGAEDLDMVARFARWVRACVEMRIRRFSAACRDLAYRDLRLGPLFPPAARTGLSAATMDAIYSGQLTLSRRPGQPLRPPGQYHSMAPSSSSLVPGAAWRGPAPVYIYIYIYIYLC